VYPPFDLNLAKSVCLGGGLPLRSNIPRSALCATLGTYNFRLNSLNVFISVSIVP
jgi:hypothetical protein